MKSDSKNRVLMVDDDTSLVGIMAIRLRQSGYTVDTAVHSNKGYALASKRPYDVLIMDVVMPGLTGYEVCANLRAQGILTPILLLSGRTEKPAIIQGLESGADDYLTKPFSFTELDARLRALVRRDKQTFNTRSIEKNGLTLDIAHNRACHGELVVHLTAKEVLLLRRLMYESPEPVNRNQLLKDVWEINDTHTSNRLDVYILRLRSKLGQIGAHNLIHTVRGNGYSFGATEEVHIPSSGK